MVLDDNLPIYRFRASSDDPLTSLLYFTHMGSEPSADYLVKRPPPAQSHNQYAIGLFDVQQASVLYAEALVTPEWSQPTLSAAEVRASAGTPVAVPLTPQAFAVTLYNPDQTVMVRQTNSSSWSKDAWEFEMPERSFKMPSASRIDQDDPGPVVADLVPKVNFRWKRDSRVSRHMTCYMSGRTVDGQKSKEPDITVALFEGGKTEGAVAIYEPNMARVDVEDRKGLEMVLLLSAEIIRDLYLAPRQDPFNVAGAPPPPLSDVIGSGSGSGGIGGKTSGSPGPPPKLLQKQPTIPVSSGAGAGAVMSGAMGDAKHLPSSSLASSSSQPPKPSSATDARRQADVEAEKRRVQALVEQEKGKTRERERRDRVEQERIKQMLEAEEQEERERRQRAVEEETERLRQKYGVQPERRPRSPPSPTLPRRPGGNGPVMSGAGSGLSNTPAPAQPPRPQSLGPSAPISSTDHVYSQPNGGGGGVGKRQKFGQFLQSSPYAGPAAASVSGFFGGGNNVSSSKEEEKRKKVKKKRSVHF